MPDFELTWHKCSLGDHLPSYIKSGEQSRAIMALLFLARQYEVQESLCVTPGVGTVGGVGVGGGVDT